MRNLRSQAAEEQQIAIFQASPHMLEVLNKCYAKNKTDLSFQEMTLMEAYFDIKIATVRADFKLLKEGMLDEDDWLARKEQVAMLLISPLGSTTLE